jgi:hypothetical protein
LGWYRKHFSLKPQPQQRLLPMPHGRFVEQPWTPVEEVRVQFLAAAVWSPGQGSVKQREVSDFEERRAAPHWPEQV